MIRRISLRACWPRRNSSAKSSRAAAGQRSPAASMCRRRRQGAQVAFPGDEHVLGGCQPATAQEFVVEQVDAGPCGPRWRWQRHPAHPRAAVAACQIDLVAHGEAASGWRGGGRDGAIGGGDALAGIDQQDDQVGPFDFRQVRSMPIASTASAVSRRPAVSMMWGNAFHLDR